MNAYQVLEIIPTDNLEKIRAAYKMQVQIYHPDNNPNAQEGVIERFTALDDAYRKLDTKDKAENYYKAHTLNALKHLLDKNASLEEKDENGLTALMVAISNGKLDIIKLLLDKGASHSVVLSTTDVPIVNPCFFTERARWEWPYYRLLASKENSTIM